MPPLPPERIHLPFEEGPFRMAMGLVPCPAAAWLELDDRYAAEMAERRHLLATRHAEVFAAVPGSEPALREVLDLVVAHLLAHHAGWFRIEDGRLLNALTGEAWDLAAPSCDPLELAGRLVQEDLCLIRPSPNGPVLEAALLCAPSRWRLSEKIGLPLRAVHGPVPLYDARLGAPVDRLMGALAPGRIAMRLNWSVVDDPALFQPVALPPPEPPITAADAGERLFLRTERQTLRRLEASGSVLFTIRVHSHPLSRLASVPGAAARLAAAVRALPEEMQAYKGFPRLRAAMLGWLDAASQPSGASRGAK